MKEFIIEIINHHLWLQFFIIYILNSIITLVYLKLGLQFNGINVNLKQLVPYLIVLPFYQIFGQIYLPRLLYSLIFLVLYIATLKFIAKTPILKNFIATIFILFLNSIGLIINHLLLAYSNNLNFLYKPQTGFILGFISEILFPAFALVIFSSFKISLNAYKNKLTTLDKLSITFFGIQFLAIYFLLISLIVIANSLKNSIFIIILSSELVLVIGAIVLFFIINHISKSEYRKQLENQQIKLELEQSDRLLEIFSSEQREYRNQLQVMKMLSERGKNEELGRYIEQIASGISIDFTVDIDNPIISSVLMSELILAREKSINVKVYCNTSLKNINFSVKLSTILKLTLKIFIEQELATRNDQNLIFLDITENNKEYLFQFKNSSAALEKLKTKAVNLPRLNQHDKFILLETYLNDLAGEYLLLDKGHTLLLKVKQPKAMGG